MGDELLIWICGGVWLFGRVELSSLAWTTWEVVERCQLLPERREVENHRFVTCGLLRALILRSLVL